MGLGSSPHLVGRDAEIDVLRQVSDAARQGRSGVLVIEGEPGIGKTRLAAELPSRLLLETDLAIRGHGLQLAGGELPTGSQPSSCATSASNWGSTSYGSVQVPDVSPWPPFTPT